MFWGPASHWNPQEYYATKPEVDNTNMAASKLKMHVSPLTDQISAKFQRLYLCFLGPAFHWDSRKYYATKPEVDNTNMAASNLEMHVFPLPDKLSTNSRGSTYVFGDRLSVSSHENTMRPSRKCEVEYSNMAASILEMHVSPLPDKISAKFQRLYLFFRGPASQWDTRACYSTKTEIDKPR